MTTYQQEYTRSLEHPEAFWREQSRQIDWFQQPPRIVSQDDEGLYHWFRGGKLNTAYLALDFHVQQGRGNQPALIYDSPVTQVTQTFTYRELLDQVASLAGVLRELGVGKGDTVVIYMPMIPQTVIAMLACARLGAIHSVVFGGFAPHELAIRIDDTRPRVLLTASAGKEVDRIIDYLDIVNAALDETQHAPAACVVYQRDFHRVDLRAGRDADWQRLCEVATPAECVEVDATDPLYILYTSGTTGRPKGILRDNGGHAVAMKYSMSSIYDVRAGDVFWAASDVGWVVGHSYIVYGPLIQGCTTVLYEGKPVRTPDAGAFWRVVADHQVSSMFAAPTAIRAIKREDPHGELIHAYDISSLRYLFLAGERCDVTTLKWTQDLLGLPVIDHWWQTESGWPMLANMVGIELLPIKPGSATKPVCGYDIHILDGEGRELPPQEEGVVAVRLPLPPGCFPNLWKNTPRFKESYLSTYPGYYSSGDGGYRDEDGYVFITGRIDDVINVAGHRLSTATIEEVVAAHPAVAECAVIGAKDELKGQLPVGFVVLKADARIDPVALQRELVLMVREQVGPVASFKKVVVTPRLPKTRSGKILRRIIRCMADGDSFQPPSTIEEPAVLEDLAAAMRVHQLGTK
jgi:acyl-coenzyme A synthetase/AMP-(fatty) acid ligase